MAHTTRSPAGFARLLRVVATPLGRGRLVARARGRTYSSPRRLGGATVTRRLFAAVANYLAGSPAPRLLSFGRSTGEEALTLARYLLTARIHGVEPNPACIMRARPAAAMTSEGARLRFRCADAPDAFGDRPYDAVLCLSVLCHGDLDRLLPTTRLR